MSDTTQQPQGAKPQPKSDMVKVRVKSRLLMQREFDSTDPTKRQVVSELYAEAGEIVELPRKEAERLAGRSFEGYPCTRDTNWGVDDKGASKSGGSTVAGFPARPDGLVRDPIVEFVA
jgi:hypothetical protein